MPRLTFGTHNPPPLTFRPVPESRAMRAAIAAVQDEARNVVARIIKARARQFITKPTWADIPLPGLRELPIQTAIDRCRAQLSVLTDGGTREAAHREAINLRAAELALRFARRWEYRRAEMEAQAPADLDRFEIYNGCTGEVLGTFEAGSEEAALAAMARSYGFADYAAVCRDAGCSVDDGRAELQIARLAPAVPEPEAFEPVMLQAAEGGEP